MNETDEGELRFGVAHDEHGNLHVNFGKPVAWFAAPQEQPINLAKMILKHCVARKIEIDF